MKRIFLILFLLSVAIAHGNAQLLHRNASRKAERGLFGKTVGNKKEVKVKESRSVLRAKKKQEKNELKKDNDYKALIKKSKKRTFDIQTSEVQTRMKQNEKNTAERDKTKKKKISSSTRKAGNKYK